MGQRPGGLESVDKHLERLYDSVKIYHAEIPFSRKDLEKAIEDGTQSAAKAERLLASTTIAGDDVSLMGRTNMAQHVNQVAESGEMALEGGLDRVSKGLTLGVPVGFGEVIGGVLDEA